MLTFVGENKRMLNIYERKFADLAAFQANTCVLGQYECLFEKFGDTSSAADLSNVESIQGCLPKGHKEEFEGLYGGNTKKWKRDRKQKRRR